MIPKGTQNDHTTVNKTIVSHCFSQFWEALLVDRIPLRCEMRDASEGRQRDLERARPVVAAGVVDPAAPSSKRAKGLYRD